MGEKKKAGECRICRMHLDDVAEFHPVEYCVLVRAEYNPKYLEERILKMAKATQKTVSA